MLGSTWLFREQDRQFASRARFSRLRLTVEILTKLNRSCLEHGEISYILPCLGRIEIDQQETGPQAVSMEDSTACIHGSRGLAKPASRRSPWPHSQQNLSLTEA